MAILHNSEMHAGLVHGYCSSWNPPRSLLYEFALFTSPNCTNLKMTIKGRWKIWSHSFLSAFMVSAGGPEEPSWGGEQDQTSLLCSKNSKSLKCHHLKPFAFFSCNGFAFCSLLLFPTKSYTTFAFYYMVCYFCCWFIILGQSKVILVIPLTFITKNEPYCITAHSAIFIIVITIQ